MYWEKKITIRITVRRVVGVVLAASTVANLIIVGVVFGADSSSATPTITSVWTSSLLTATLSISTAATGWTSTSTWTHTPGGLLTDTPGIIQTESLLPTNTSTPTETIVYSPDPKFCIRKFYWPRYRVQQGDTLSSLAWAIRSTVPELMSANCLSTSLIYTGQILFMPRLPYTATMTPSATDTLSATATPSQTATNTLTATETPTKTYTPITPSVTPTYTPSPTSTDTPTNTYTPSPTSTDTPSPTSTSTETSTPTNTPTGFQNVSVMNCDPTKYASFSVSPSDPDGIAAVFAQLYTKDNALIIEIPLNRVVQNIYSGTGLLPGRYTVYEVYYYQFRAVDDAKHVTISQAYYGRSESCIPATPTPETPVAQLN